MKALGYMRCSGDAQVFGDTWDRQESAINKYAMAQEIEIVGWFRDEGVSGKLELENRPGLAACLERVESNGVRVILVECADRLARDAMVAELIIRQFQKAHCQVISASGGVDLTAGDDSNPTAKLVRQVLAAVAEFDRCMIVLKTRAARERIRASGKKCEGRKAYGARPGEEKGLETIIGWHEMGKTPDSIADFLNTMQLPTRYGKRWHGATVSKILARHEKESKTAPLPCATS